MYPAFGIRYADTARDHDISRTSTQIVTTNLLTMGTVLYAPVQGVKLSRFNKAIRNVESFDKEKSIRLRAATHDDPPPAQTFYWYLVPVVCICREYSVLLSVLKLYCYKYKYSYVLEPTKALMAAINRRTCYQVLLQVLLLHAPSQISAIRNNIRFYNIWYFSSDWMFRLALRRLRLKRPRSISATSRHFSSICSSVDGSPTHLIANPSRSLIHSSLARTPEGERAVVLEYDAMLKLTEQVLALERFQISDVQAIKRALNYWTSIRAHHHTKYERRRPHELPFASKLFRAIIERGDPSTIQEIVKTDEHPMGGLTFLIEHLLYAFRDTHQLVVVEKDASIFQHHDLLEALIQASSVLNAMKELQADPMFPGIPEDMFHVNLMELNVWSKRAWFFNQFVDTNLSDAQINLACGGQRTVEGCVTAMTNLAKDLLNQDYAPHSKIYTTIISTWVHSGLPNSLEVVLETLNHMEGDDRIDVLSPIPYSAAMYICSKQKAADVAQRLWERMQAPDSGVVPDATTLATYLLALVDSNQLDHALTTLNEAEATQEVLPGLTNTNCYNVVIRGLAKSSRPDAALQAEALLQRMTQLSETRVNPWVAPDRFSYSATMEIFSGRCGAKVEQILLHCKSLSTHNKELEPDRVMYNIALDSYAADIDSRGDRQALSSASAARSAEGLLRVMESHPDSQPNTISYNSVLNVVVKAQVEFQRVDALFQEMKDKFSAGDATVKPDIITYNTVLRAIARDSPGDSIDNAIAFMDEMRKNGMKPDRVTFNILMDAVIKNNNPGAATYAEQVLEKMELDSASGGVRPDASSYNTVLNGYAKMGTMDAVQRAEQLLQRMLTISQEESRRDSRPDFVSYTCVMDAYARSRAHNAGFQAEVLLDSMDREGIPANTICYNTAINCWAKSGHTESPQRAERLLNKMQQAAENNPGIKPNSVSFSSVMNCWAQSNLEGAAERAEAILNHMELLAKNGDRDMTPNAYSYSTVMSAWAKVGGVEQALSILDRVENAHAAGKSHVRPNFYFYNAAINAIAKSRTSDKAEAAAALLHRMKLQHKEHGFSDLMPTAITYSSVLNACAYTVCKDDAEKANAFRIARETFRDLLSGHEPTSTCYVNFLSACIRLLPPGSKRDEMVVAVFRDCRQRGHVNERVARSFEQAVDRVIFLRETQTAIAGS